jgi:hypothetical protein
MHKNHPCQFIQVWVGSEGTREKEPHRRTSMFPSVADWGRRMGQPPAASPIAGGRRCPSRAVPHDLGIGAGLWKGRRRCWRRRGGQGRKGMAEKREEGGGLGRLTARPSPCSRMGMGMSLGIGRGRTGSLAFVPLGNSEGIRRSDPPNWEQENKPARGSGLEFGCLS